MTTAYDNYRWRRTEPNRWERDADEAEIAYSALIKLYEGSGRMEFAITGHVSLAISLLQGESADAASDLLDECLGVAWLRLRHQMPTIASRVVYDSSVGKWKKIYDAVTNETERAAWLQETFKTVANGQTGVEWANSDPPAPEVATIFSIAAPAASSTPLEIRRDIVLRSPHDIIDGIGTLQLLNAFAHHVSEALDQGPRHDLPPFNLSEIARLSPPYRIAAAVPEQPTPQQAEKIVAIQTIQPESSSRVQTIGIPFKAGPLLPGKHQRVAHVIPSSRTTKLLAALKSVGATPTHAFHAAIPMVVRDLHSEANPSLEGKQVQYVNYILRNERQSCRPPFNTPAHSSSVYHSISGGKLTVTMYNSVPPTGEKRNQGFLRILDEIKSFYLAIRDDKDHYALAPYIWAKNTSELRYPKTNDTAEWKGLNPVPKPNDKPSVSISSMGLIDRMVDAQVGRVRVDNPWVTGEELGTGLGLFLGTFKGVLELSAAYNDAWHDKEEVERFLTRCEEIVFGWLDSLE